VIEILDLNTTPSALSNQITVSNANNSQVVNISVQDEQAFLAVDIANTVAQVFQEEVKELMNVDNVNILSPAELPENPSPVKPNKMLNMAIALVIGLMVGVGLAFLLEYLDTTIKTEHDVEELLGLPILGFVSKITDANSEVPLTVKSKRAVRRENVNV
jgi:capsular polysaccharide biosynthesis protein